MNDRPGGGVSLPDAYVEARLHGGPHDGETIQLPWARVDLPMIRWEGDAMVVSSYRLSKPWRGQAWAEYVWVCEEQKKAA